MKIQIVKCSDTNLWYSKKQFPIKTDVIEGIDKYNKCEADSLDYNNFFSTYDAKDFYYSDNLMGYIAKSDCINDEEYSTTLEDSKKSFNYELKARPWEPEFKPLEDLRKIKSKDVISNTKEAKKNDGGKPSFSSIPQLALLEVAKAFTHGREKYGLFNYSGNMEVLRYIDAGDRHKNQFLTYADKDDIDESGVHHLALQAANTLMALDAILTGKIIDNRNKIYKK